MTVGGVVAISCRGVSKRFPLLDKGSGWRLAFGRMRDVPCFPALDGVTFDVPRGQFVGVVGRNGAGKSTLLRVLGGVYSPDDGRVAVSGALSGLYELGLAGNPQQSGRSYADRLLAVHGFSRRERAVMTEEIKDFSELGDRFDDPVITYSAGMAARLFFSTATAGRYDVYLIDEILSVGDQHFQGKCWRRLRDRVAQGASGVLVTHDWSAVASMCETAHMLQDGRIACTGPAERVVRTYLYGEAGRQSYTEGVARFVSLPEGGIVVRQGDDLRVEVGVEVLQDEDVRCVSLIERFQRGVGWENMLMSRGPTMIGRSRGRYAVEILVPCLPVDPGFYQFGVTLVTPDRERGGRSVQVLDNRSWIDGNGIAVEVTGDPADGVDLGIRWELLPATEGIAA